MSRVIFHLVLLASFFFVDTAWAQTPGCQQLEAEQKKLAQKILASQHAYDCCDQSLDRCLQAKPICALAYRLAENICRRVGEGQDEKTIARALSRRATSMMSTGKKAVIDLTDVPFVGEAQAPVVLVEYACARCPFCSKITPALHQAVTEGKLKGKVRFYFKTFPIRSHPFSKEGGFAFLSAAEMGGFWDYLLYVYGHFDMFCVKKLPLWAQQLGLDQQEFSDRMKSPGIRERLVACKKEGIVNRVDATPTFFLNGRKFLGDLTLAEMIDVLEEEHDLISQKLYRK